MIDVVFGGAFEGAARFAFFPVKDEVTAAFAQEDDKLWLQRTMEYCAPIEGEIRRVLGDNVVAVLTNISGGGAMAVFIGAMAMLVVTNPVVMTQVLGILVLVVLPSLYFGRRVRSLSRASQDRVADSSAIAATSETTPFAFTLKR
mgnify:CR=1 FL=1